MSQTASKDGRTRNFATVVYPESAPQGWKKILEEERIPALISPLHELDCNADGEVKKAHYHILVKFAGKKSPEQVQAIFEKFGGVGCETVNSFRSYARYLCHLDNPEKAQYNVNDVVSLNGIDYLEEIGTPADKYKAIRQMIKYCRENSVYSFADLLEYCEEEREDWFRVLCDSSTYVIKEYLKSRSWGIEQAQKKGK